MISESPEFNELFGLLSDLVDGSLTPAGRDRLRERLRDDPEAQDLYLRFMELHARLHLDYDSGSGPMNMPGASSMPLKPIAALPVDQPIGDHPVDDFDAVDASLSVTRPWSIPIVVGGACFAALLAIGLAVVFRGPWARREPVAVAAPGKVDVADGVAVVVRTADTRWEMDGGRVPKEGDILPKGRMKVHGGRATLSMLNGVSVIVEGPADLEFLSVDRIACLNGRLRARVPEGAEGFVISGPGSAVIDRGTEFGVNIKADGKSRGKVFEGEVEAAVLGHSGALSHSEVVGMEGDPFEIDPVAGLISPIAGPEDFVTPSVAVPSPLVLDPSYRDIIREARPRHYWRFEALNEGIVPDEIAGGSPLIVNGPIRLAGDPSGNRCVQFGPGQPNQSLLLDGSWKPEKSPGYAVELWFLSETIGHAALASMIAPKDTTHHLSLVELTTSNRFSLFRPASVRFLYRWPTGRGGGDNLFSDDIYVPGRWHHLVAQVANDRMELYLDGKAQATHSIGTAGSTTPCQLILGRLTTLSDVPGLHHTGYRRAFVGLMDEVAIYDRPLAAEEVRVHHRLATRPNRPD